MRSRIYVGSVMHARHAPVEHAFRYPAFVFAIDIDELSELDATLRLFAVNRSGLFSLHEGDYLGESDGRLRDKLVRRMARAGAEFAVDRVVLVTTPRVLGHAFNPVSFYYCYALEGTLAGIVAEVNNTFGEGHVYVLPVVDSLEPGETARFAAAKTFHVSPFNDMRGNYGFAFAPLGERLDVRIDIDRDGARAFASRLQGQARPLDDGGLLRLVASYPFTAALTLPRILWQAYKLHYRRGLPVFAKPEPSSENTFAATRPAYVSELSAPRHRAGAGEDNEIGETHGSR